LSKSIPILPNDFESHDDDTRFNRELIDAEICFLGQKVASGMSKPRVVRLCLVGDAGVGKSALIGRIRFEIFQDEIQPTVGAVFSKAVWRSADGTDSIEFQFWDTAGSEKFHSYIPHKLKSSHAILLVFDVSELGTFESISSWMISVNNSAPEDVRLFVVGNKIDCERKVTREIGAQFAQNIGAEYIEASVKSGQGVPDLLLKLATVPSDPAPIELQHSEGPKKSCCN
jgi:Ras-related protein Rab-5C